MSRPANSLLFITDEGTSLPDDVYQKLEKLMGELPSGRLKVLHSPVSESHFLDGYALPDLLPDLPKYPDVRPLIGGSFQAKVSPLMTAYLERVSLPEDWIQQEVARKIDDEMARSSMAAFTTASAQPTAISFDDLMRRWQEMISKLGPPIPRMTKIYCFSFDELRAAVESWGGEVVQSPEDAKAGVLWWDGIPVEERSSVPPGKAVGCIENPIRFEYITPGFRPNSGAKVYIIDLGQPGGPMKPVDLERDENVKG